MNVVQLNDSPIDSSIVTVFVDGVARTTLLSQQLGNSETGKLFLYVDPYSIHSLFRGSCKYAIKIITNKQYFSKFLTQNATIHALKHPNVAAAPNIYVHTEAIMLQMLYYSTGSLRSLIHQRSTPFPQYFCTTIGKDITRALCYLNEHDETTHRNVTTNNILIRGINLDHDLIDVILSDFDSIIPIDENGIPIT
jgi:serine/threonine protein kinase